MNADPMLIFIMAVVVVTAVMFGVAANTSAKKQRDQLVLGEIESVADLKLKAALEYEYPDEVADAQGDEIRLQNYQLVKRISDLIDQSFEQYCTHEDLARRHDVLWRRYADLEEELLQVKGELAAARSLDELRRF